MGLGKNKNFDLGLGYKSEFVSTPTKVEGVDRNDIIDFSPLRGGFVYINTDGELWGLERISIQDLGFL